MFVVLISLFNLIHAVCLLSFNFCSVGSHHGTSLIFRCCWDCGIVWLAPWIKMFVILAASLLVLLLGGLLDESVSVISLKRGQLALLRLNFGRVFGGIMSVSSNRLM